MPIYNKSHYNNGHRMMNYFNKSGLKHSSDREKNTLDNSYHIVFNEEALEFLKKIPDQSIQLIICDPPYNIDIEKWDIFSNYIDWAYKWLNEIPRVLKDTGSFLIFGGIQYENEKSGDLLEIIHYLRHNSSLKIINFIIWYYKSGMSAHRFFANKHEEIVWYVKTKKYTFNLDNVRIPFDEETKKLYLKDSRLNPESVEKGKNPSNVWEIPRLTGNSKERGGHPTQKPAAIIQRLVRALTDPGDIVLDFFAGSGITTKVCIEEGRHSIINDIDKNLSDYLQKHIDKINDPVFTIPYILLQEDEYNKHPIFKNKKE